MNRMGWYIRLYDDAKARPLAYFILLAVDFAWLDGRMHVLADVEDFYGCELLERVYNELR